MYSIVDLSGSQGESNFNFSFGYLSEAHLHVYIDGVETEDFSLSATYTITLDTALTSNATVRIRRITPIDEAMVDWSNGSVLGESDLDTTVLQVLYAQQELDDEATDLITMQLANGGSWDAQGEKIENLATPTAPTDAVNKSYADGLFAASIGSVPITALQDVDPASTIDTGTLMVGDGGAPALLTSLARGNNLDILEVDTTTATNLRWRSLATKLFQLLSTKGDLLVSTGAAAQVLPVGDDDQILIADSGEAAGVRWGSAAPIVNNALPGCIDLAGDWASTSTFQISAEVVILRDSNGLCVRVPGTVKTININTAGPAVEGRDQAGSFSPSSWIHLYWIYNPTTDTLSSICSSGAAPPSGPTMPSGYTYWCYVATLRLNSSTQLYRDHLRGNLVTRGPVSADTVLIDRNTTTAGTAASLANVVPPEALSVLLDMGIYATAAAGGPSVTARIYADTAAATGFNFTLLAYTQVATQTAVMRFMGELPYLSSYWYDVSDSGVVSTRQFQVIVAGYRLPNHST